MKKDLWDLNKVDEILSMVREETRVKEIDNFAREIIDQATYKIEAQCIFENENFEVVDKLLNSLGLDKLYEYIGRVAENT